MQNEHPCPRRKVNAIKQTFSSSFFYCRWCYFCSDFISIFHQFMCRSVKKNRLHYVFVRISSHALNCLVAQGMSALLVLLRNNEHVEFPSFAFTMSEFPHLYVMHVA